ncbi:MAG: NAD(+) diphosphatase [Mesorhizobium sp.]
MSFSLFDAPQREPSQFVGFAGSTIERLSEKRGDDATEQALADPQARIMLSKGGRIYLRQDGELFDGWMKPLHAQAFGARLDQAILLGWQDGAPRLAAPAGIEPEELPPGMKAIDHRSTYAQGLLPDSDLGALAQAAALLTWHGTHRFCGRCGAKTEMRAGGYKRVCTGCNAEHFPRTDPVAIMLTVTQDRCLMGRSPHFAPNMYSCLAGFIEPGETIENAVRRETFEEAGIRLGRVTYHASQPWPFPHTLMIGCFGEALNEDIVADKTELEDVRWFTRAETLDIINGRSELGITAPPRMAIAHTLIRAWAESE